LQKTQLFFEAFSKVGDNENLRIILQALKELPENGSGPLILPVHPEPSVRQNQDPVHPDPFFAVLRFFLHQLPEYLRFPVIRQKPLLPEEGFASADSAEAVIRSAAVRAFSV